ncbi:unnamed protein product [Symbiodinium pilosum]|uniref:Uncharacterized protein n=1 Tax=Symbiodinium pilosum TaxID=2952 RepID=A0A812N3Z6_SYMPI|nr:unnamed protein product [Symbiodinium pilosum]
MSYNDYEEEQDGPDSVPHQQLEQAVLDPYGGMLPADADNAEWYGAVEDTSQLIKEESLEDSYDGFRWVPAARCEVAWDVLHVSGSSDMNDAWVWAKVDKDESQGSDDDLVLWEAPDRNRLRAAWKDVLRSLKKPKRDEQVQEPSALDSPRSMKMDPNKEGLSTTCQTLTAQPETPANSLAAQPKAAPQPGPPEPKKRSVSYQRPVPKKSALLTSGTKTVLPRPKKLAHPYPSNSGADVVPNADDDQAMAGQSSEATAGKSSAQPTRRPQQVSGRGVKRDVPMPTRREDVGLRRSKR